MMMQSCPYCGGRHALDAQFCPETGHRLERAGNPCPSCGEELPAEASFCPNCRYALQASIPPETVRQEPWQGTSPDRMTTDADLIDELESGGANMKGLSDFEDLKSNQTRTPAKISPTLMILVCVLVLVLSSGTGYMWQARQAERESEKTISTVTLAILPGPVSPTSTHIATNTPIPSETPTTISVTSPQISTPASEIDQNQVTLVDAERVFEYSEIENITYLAKEKYFLSDYNKMNNTLTFTVNMNISKPVLWKANWCAKNKQTLEENLQQIQVQFFLNNDEILPARFAHEYYENEDVGEMNGWNCFVYKTVLTDWKPGTYEIITKFNFLRKINDGRYDYPKGWQASLYTVTVK